MGNGQGGKTPLKVTFSCVSPTHKRAEGRAPVWGSEFTSKDATLQGGSSRNRCWAKCKIVDFGGDWLTGGELPPPLLSRIFYLNLLKPSRKISNLAQRN
jgi:hypothetical protein